MTQEPAKFEKYRFRTVEGVAQSREVGRRTPILSSMVLLRPDGHRSEYQAPGYTFFSCLTYTSIVQFIHFKTQKKKKIILNFMTMMAELHRLLLSKNIV